MALGRIRKKIARFKLLKSSSIYFQNDLAFLGRIGKPSLSEFPEIYAQAFSGQTKIVFDDNQGKSIMQCVNFNEESIPYSELEKKQFKNFCKNGFKLFFFQIGSGFVTSKQFFPQQLGGRP